MLSKYYLLQSISLPSIYKNGHTYHNSVITRLSIFIHHKRPAKQRSSSSISCSQNNGKSIIFHNTDDFLFRGFQTLETGGFSHQKTVCEMASARIRNSRLLTVSSKEMFLNLCATKTAIFRAVADCFVFCDFKFKRLVNAAVRELTNERAARSSREQQLLYQGELVRMEVATELQAPSTSA